MPATHHFTYRDGIAVAQIVFFTAAVICAYYLRRTRRIGWFTIGVLSIFRLVAASCLLVTINHDSDSAWAGVFVCESLGVIVTIFLLLDMLQRINVIIEVAHRWTFLIPSLLTLLDIGISIGGFYAVSHKTQDQLLPTAWSRAGVAILVLIYLYTVGVFALFWLRRGQYPQTERRLLLCVAVCIPFLAVRILYPFIWAIAAKLTWSPVKGNATAYLLMTVLPEVAIVTVSAVTILRTAPLPEKGKEVPLQDAGESAGSWRENGDRQTV